MEPVVNFGMGAIDPRQLGTMAGQPKTIEDADLADRIAEMTTGEHAAFAKTFRASMTKAMQGFRATGKVRGIVYDSGKVRRRILVALGPVEGPAFEASLHLDNLEHAAGTKLRPADRAGLVAQAVSAPERMNRLHQHVARKLPAKA